MDTNKKLDKCSCCKGENVFTCEMCGTGLASEPLYFVDTSGLDLDPNYEHAIWVCVGCKDRK